jgi:formylglycine-generating enzyme required for sulfatase activity
METWVYLTPGCQGINVITSKHGTVKVVFAQHGVKELSASTTYYLTLADAGSRSGQMGNLHVNYMPVGCEVLLDGKSIGKSPRIFNSIPTGRHTMIIKKNSYETVTETILVSSTETVAISGKLMKKETDVISGNMGRLTVDYEPKDCDVLLNGTVIGKTPGVFSDINPGDYLLEIKHDNYYTEQRNITIGSGQSIIVKGQLHLNNEMLDNAKRFTANGVDFYMVEIPEGSFKPGYPDWRKLEQPLNMSSFMIGMTEVTQELWEAVMGNNPSEWKGKDYPVENVNWYDCQEFIRKLNQITGKSFSLPTTCQWLYAQYCGWEYDFWGDGLWVHCNDYGWTERNSGGRTHPVATKKADKMGLFDMWGNVGEWCSDEICPPWLWKEHSLGYSNPSLPNENYKAIGGSHALERDNQMVIKGFTYVSPDGKYYAPGMRGLRLCLNHSHE